jgi:hypothetical protein
MPTPYWLTGIGYCVTDWKVWMLVGILILVALWPERKV